MLSGYNAYYSSVDEACNAKEPRVVKVSASKSVFPFAHFSHQNHSPLPTIEGPIDRIWPIDARQRRPVAQRKGNGLIYLRLKGGCNLSDARLLKWPRSNVI